MHISPQVMLENFVYFIINPIYWQKIVPEHLCLKHGLVIEQALTNIVLLCFWYAGPM